MPNNFNILKAIDKRIVAIYFVLIVFGLLNIFSTTYDPEALSHIGFSTPICKQFVWVALSLTIGLMILFTDWHVWENISYSLYGIMILLLIVTIFISPNIKGSHSWIRISSSFSIQPAEFSKFITALALAKFMSSNLPKLHIFWRCTAIFLMIALPMLIIIAQSETGSALVYAMFFVMLYRHGLPGWVLALVASVITVFIFVIRFLSVPFFGNEQCSSGIVIGMLIVLAIAHIFLLVYRPNRARTTENFFDHNMPWWAIGASLAVLTIPLLVNCFIVQFNYLYVIAIWGGMVAVFLIVWSIIRWRASYLLIALFIIFGFIGSLSANFLFYRMLHDYQQNRVLLILKMIDDPQGIGYNIEQSRLAIGAGGLLGKGFLKGTQTHLKYVPEQETDFIFSAIGEEWGFIGAFGVILLLGMLIVLIIQVAERSRSRFVCIYAYFIAGIFMFHLLINIGMVIGIMPVIGIPLPFISYGGSSLLSFTIMIAILLRLDAMRLERILK